MGAIDRVWVDAEGPSNLNRRGSRGLPVSYLDRFGGWKAVPRVGL